MKKIIAIFIMIFTLSFLSSCVNKRINYIEAGAFVGTNEEDPSEKFYLNVTEITENDYLNANGLNVIEDQVRDGFYRIEFYTINLENEKTVYNFYNLRDAYNGATGTPIAYEDDNDSWFKPQGFKSEYENGEMNYSIHFKIKENPKEYIYVYLFKTDE